MLLSRRDFQDACLGHSRVRSAHQNNYLGTPLSQCEEKSIFVITLDPDVECHLLAFNRQLVVFPIFYRLLVNNLLLNSE